MASTGTGVNVLRWGAMVFGVFYGLSHQTSLSSQAKASAAQHDYDRKAKLIDQAKAEFKKQTTPQDSKTGGAITDPNDPKFDLEAYLTQAQAQS
ncbi:hypothetical protein LTR36_002590 [Oleoguttula mirabilis]|uniref:ATP synthase F(0) complex subunit e, mitochondrial n=1 Tax=Oleoguttula mirabilis TaxID=1507867 RepID=A0AAV9JKW8_9PEZI|nr:hypothetical protein LTR36_002590 [Oleoguttula mirabilis]